LIRKVNEFRSDGLPMLHQTKSNRVPPM
jgi:hypothetical protein